ncbi:Multicopper oxidase with three cupredoxin domains [Geosmithia morbida]|uniref:Multicopper oxidase with three cupredoxin domains n=1 Tax=Geosmithia morbida TaxID=1094350 RepID=A0A9P4YRU2_9HYPO|nr:Multicopper oxidase with three cupredoxin domains [Geosmithia morbida]KAF4120553.1 Multicopper oxidase with three cupredoxin domains [Geosmithia morbida]
MAQLETDESRGPFLGVDEIAGQAVPRWKEKMGQGRRSKSRLSRRGVYVISALVVLLHLSVSLIVFSQRHPSSTGRGRSPSSSAEPQSGIEVSAPQRGGFEILLNPRKHRSREQGTRKYRWVVSQAIISPDGVEKEVFLINGIFPGPTIEARSGDVLEIEIRGDGLYGGLIVHSPENDEAVVYDYDEELLLMVGDWYHRSYQDALGSSMSVPSTGDEPAPDSLLINGQGHFECSMAVPASPADCTEVSKPWLSLDKKHSYRVRVINVGSLAGISFSVPDSEMQVIQVDGGRRVDSNKTSNSMGVLYPGERVDFLMSWPEAALDMDTELTVQLDREYFTRPNLAPTPDQSFALTVEASTRRPARSSSEITHFNLSGIVGMPLSRLLPKPLTTFTVFSAIEITSRKGMVPKGFINHTAWVPQSRPLITLNPEDWNEHQFVPWTGAEPGWVELTINNVDGTGYPFHLHGFDFYVVGSHQANGGRDHYDPFDSKKPRGGPFNLENPVSKDTVYVPPHGYVVIRFKADNEGIWLLHCDVLWQQGSSMAMAFQVMGKADEGVTGTWSSNIAGDYCASIDGDDASESQ